MIKIIRERNPEYVTPQELAKNDIAQFVDWFTSLNIKKRIPSGVNKVDHQVLLNVKERVEDYIYSTLPNHLRVQEAKMIGMALTNLRMTLAEMEEAYMVNETDTRPETLQLGRATYHKKSSFAYDKFLQYSQRLEDLFSTLRRPHNEVLDNLHVQFKDSKDMNAIATYKTNRDMLYINPKKVSSLKDVYGSLEYVVLHELGHRYLAKNPQSWNIDDNKWITTKYSQVDSFSGEEKFAELFALSYYAKDYPEHREQIKAFLQMIE